MSSSFSSGRAPRVSVLLGVWACVLLIAISYAAAQDFIDPVYPPFSIDTTRLERPPDLASAERPEVRYQIHNAGLFWNTFNNNGIMGNYFNFDDTSYYGRPAPNFQYPERQRRYYGNWAGIWIGGIVGQDTLVSTAPCQDQYSYYGYRSEFYPDYGSLPEYEIRSNDPSSPYYHPRAVADQEFVCVYADTFVYMDSRSYNRYDRRYHKPLGIKVTQTSRSWKAKHAQDFVIIEYEIENVGNNTIRDLYLGIYHTGMIYSSGEQPSGGAPQDDIPGFLQTYDHLFEGAPGKDTVNIAWVVDNDGKAGIILWDRIRTDNAYAIAPLKTPQGADRRHFNWFVWTNYRQSWGPRRMTLDPSGVRYFHGHLGYPYGDNNKYYLMANPEVDYSGYLADVSNPGFLPPHETQSGSIARGHYPSFIYSMGPVTMYPTERRTFWLVSFIGERVHHNRTAYQRTFRTYSPWNFVNQLKFDNVVQTFRWARTIFDNPGVDSNFDGDSGRYVFIQDTLTGDSIQAFYLGDGVPDWGQPKPPPAPTVRLMTERNRIVVRWNGRESETAYDPFTATRDFEGYRVYIARYPDDLDGYAMLRSWDKENYQRWKYNWDSEYYVQVNEPPLDVGTLRAMYGEDFEPSQTGPVDPLRHRGDFYYFERVDYNQSDLTDPRGIRKVYPDAQLDTLDVDDEGRMRYYEYEYVIEDVMATIPYFVSVTAFDHGYPARNLGSTESDPRTNAQRVFAQAQGDDIAVTNGTLNAYVYPNPYRMDANYRSMGYEGVGTDAWAERTRSIYFANIPRRCTVTIWSLDGDLIREIRHNEPEGSGTASIAHWDMINKNNETVTSGLYYFTVESDYGTQIGTFMIIR
jgi:hypothetical protein